MARGFAYIICMMALIHTTIIVKQKHGAPEAPRAPKYDASTSRGDVYMIAPDWKWAAKAMDSFLSVGMSEAQTWLCNDCSTSASVIW